MIRAVGSDIESVLLPWRRSILQGDRSLIFRVVGFLEYAAALRYLDELVNQVTPEELIAINQLIEERPEFTVYTNLSSGLANRPTTLIPVGGPAGNVRRGLAWVMALARVELGAILATFDAHPDPFAVTRPTQLEWDAYRALLLDEAEVHFWSLSRDPDVERVAQQTTPSITILAYVRRLTEALYFLHAAMQSRRDSLTPAQLAELAEQEKQLSQLRVIFRLKIASFLSAGGNNSESLKECCRMLAVEAQDRSAAKSAAARENESDQ